MKRPLCERSRSAPLLGWVAGVFLLMGCGGGGGFEWQAENPLQPLASASDRPAPEARLEIRLTEHGITLSAIEAPLATVVDELARLAGMDVVANDPLAEAVTIELRQQPVEAAIEALLSHRNYTLAYASGGANLPRTLHVYGPRRDARHSEVALALSDPDKGVRIDAVIELMAERDAETRAQVIATALADSDVNVRLEAVEAMGEFPDDRAVSRLRQVLQDPEAEVREAAVEVLGRLGGAQSAMVLTAALTDTDVTVREEAVYSLGRIGGSLALGSLRLALADPDEAVRETARELLADLEPDF